MVVGPPDGLAVTAPVEQEKFSSGTGWATPAATDNRDNTSRRKAATPSELCQMNPEGLAPVLVAPKRSALYSASYDLELIVPATN